MSPRMRILIPGVVQGIGFRPRVHRLACESRSNGNIRGFVRNESSGVRIEAEARDPEVLSSFLDEVARISPREGWIVDKISDSPDSEEEPGFQIRASVFKSGADPVLSPDRGICDACRSEFGSQSNRRFRYPFISCAECGPRQSISLGLPYDRKSTSFAEFPMCEDCEHEFRDPEDRRFHAQAISCPRCGPQLELRARGGEILARGVSAIAEAARRIKGGDIIAAKGIGGFHLLADATSEEAITTLRLRKRREEKPFAIMVGSVEVAQDLACLSNAEIEVLRSPEAPVLLARRRTNTEIAPSVAPGLNRLGILCASTGLHLLLLESVGGPIVATSGNRSDEPLCIDDSEAVRRLGDIADAFLTHSLRIVNRLDDSIVEVVAGEPRCLRRARGYPLRIECAGHCDPPLLAGGADLKSAIALFAGPKKVLSPHLGNLATVEACEAFDGMLRDLPAAFGVHPGRVAIDLHPDYVSSRYAIQSGLPSVPVQHHCAHVASVVAECGLKDKAVLGVAWDGTGFGLDGTSWGGEFLWFSHERIARIASLRPFPLIGGDAAAREPRRVAFALAREAGVELDTLRERLDLSSNELGNWEKLRSSSPHTSSIGRLFDGVSALLGLRGKATFEGQAAMELQAEAERDTSRTHSHSRIASLFDRVGGEARGPAMGLETPDRANHR